MLRVTVIDLYPYNNLCKAKFGSIKMTTNKTAMSHSGSICTAGPLASMGPWAWDYITHA